MIKPYQTEYEFSFLFFLVIFNGGCLVGNLIPHSNCLHQSVKPIGVYHFFLVGFR